MPRHMNRKFVPVGHGGFAVEDIDRRKIVFDCGCKSKKLIEQQINKVFCKDQDILAVFISHFHNDHVNGLQHLLRRCKVKRVIIPYLNPVAKLTLLINDGTDDEFYRELVLDAPSAIRELSRETDVVVVEETPQDFSGTLDILENNDARITYSSEQIDLLRDQEGGTRGIAFGLSFGIAKSDWHFFPYNQSQNQYRAKFLSELRNQGINPMLLSDKNLAALLKDPKNISKIRSAYNNTTKLLNITTMVIFSGPKVACMSKLCYSNCSMTANWYKKRGCLYMGDYEAKAGRLWDDLKNFYTAYWNDFGIFTIPHHGSIKNYHNEMAQLRCYHMITADNAPTPISKHPDIRVTSALSNHYIIDRKNGREINYHGGCQFTQPIVPYTP